MKRIPHAHGVVKALRAVRMATQMSLKGLNQVASQRMARGDYAAAEVLAAKGKEIRQFQLEVEAIAKRWRDVCRTGGGGAKASATPLWTYYQPILKALVEAGGTAARMELEPGVERLMSARLQPEDREPLGRGSHRWQVMIRRARKHLADEGWIESGPSATWRITDAGRRAAEKALGPPRSVGD